jgi:phosphate transport system permease protein
LNISFKGFLDPFSVLPIQVFNWVSRPQKAFLECAAAGIIVLLLITLCMNGAAIYLRQKNQYKK